ncbi:MAG: formylmethanofuran dehydrogenase subunit C [Anaerolineae bacterium]|nr:formylmethanofuran dehydrogenase subunit C [Anaerolineae bacterium]MDH7475611.1 formylmethanofuran dehydrogenase subunit C [Anaerolineae bacterium]
MGCISCAGLMKEDELAESVVTLRLREPTTIPIEADSICPDNFANRSRGEIEALPVFYGRRKMKLGELFEVEGEKSDTIILQGDLRQVKKIGQRMTRGRITVQGDVGMHLGAYMRGGEIVVEGNAGDWAGAHMQGGRIWIRGNAGHLLGAAYRGEKRGVNRGVIVVEGNAGREVGAQMRRGLIVVLGDVGEFAGAKMIAGTILVSGRLGARAGAGMKRGTIVALADHDELLPTFRYECRYQPVFLRYYLLRLREWGMTVGDEYVNGFYRRYHGDITALGKGELLIYDQR